MRDRLSGDLGFSEADEIEHLRRVAEITRLLNDQGLTVVASVLAPDETNLCQMIELIGRDRCIEISLDALNQVFVDKPSNRCDVTSRHVVFDEQNGTEIGAEGSLKALLTVSAGAEWLKEPIAHILTGLQRSGSLRSG